MRFCLIAVVSALFTLCGTANASTIAFDSSGQITGITGLEVRDDFDNSLIGVFDVTFQEGTCANLFSGCDENADFIANTSGDGGHFTDALLKGLGDLDDPTSIFGCESTAECYITIPRGLSGNGMNVPGSALWVVSGAMNDLPITESYSLLRFDDTTLDSTRVFAVFSEVSITDPVPLPAAAPLFLAGLAGIGGLRRKRANAQWSDSSE